LFILPSNLSADVNSLFNTFENATSDTTDVSQQDKRKAILQSILDLIQKNTAVAGQSVKENQLDPLDMESVVLPNICKIMNSYSLVSQLCPNVDIKIVDTAVVKSNSSGTPRWNILLWIVGIGA